MAKAIIKINAFLTQTQLKRLINDVKMQSKNDVIFVPAYCDVYVLEDDAKIEVRTKYKNNATTSRRSNTNRKIEEIRGDDSTIVPC